VLRTSYREKHREEEREKPREESREVYELTFIRADLTPSRAVRVSSSRDQRDLCECSPACEPEEAKTGA
jgi:hypothetical protein